MTHSEALEAFSFILEEWARKQTPRWDGVVIPLEWVGVGCYLSQQEKLWRDAMIKPWELTDEEISEAIETSWDTRTYQDPIKECHAVARAAQRELVKWLNENISRFSDNSPTVYFPGDLWDELLGEVGDAI